MTFDQPLGARAALLTERAITLPDRSRADRA